MKCLFCRKPFGKDPWLQPVPTRINRLQVFAHKGCLADYEYEMAYDREQHAEEEKVQQP